MAKTSGRIRFSLRTLLLLPLVVLAGLIWVGWQFKYGVASGTPGFEISIHELHSGSDAHDQFGNWLTTKGYKLSQRPKLGSHYPRHRESWYFGEHNDIEHYIFVCSNDSIIRAEVYFEAEQWIVQDTRMSTSETSAIDEVAHEIRSWREQNSLILPTRQPED